MNFFVLNGAVIHGETVCWLYSFSVVNVHINCKTSTLCKLPNKYCKWGLKYFELIHFCLSSEQLKRSIHTLLQTTKTIDVPI